MIIDLAADLYVTVRVADVARHHTLTREPASDTWHAYVQTATDTGYRGPWDYMDDGPQGPVLDTTDLAEAVAFIRDTAAKADEHDRARQERRLADDKAVELERKRRLRQAADERRKAGVTRQTAAQRRQAEDQETARRWETAREQHRRDL